MFFLKIFDFFESLPLSILSIPRRPARWSRMENRSCDAPEALRERQALVTDVSSRKVFQLFQDYKVPCDLILSHHGTGEADEIRWPHCLIGVVTIKREL